MEHSKGHFNNLGIIKSAVVGNLHVIKNKSLLNQNKSKLICNINLKLVMQGVTCMLAVRKRTVKGRPSFAKKAFPSSVFFSHPVLCHTGMPDELSSPCLGGE